MEVQLTLGAPTGVADIPVTFPDPMMEHPVADPFAIPYDSVLCLELVFRRVEELAESGDGGVRFLAEELMRRVEKAPALRKPITDPQLLEQHKDIMELLLIFLVPPTEQETALFKFSRPYEFQPIYVSPAMQQLMSIDQACYSFGNRLQEVVDRHLVTVGCAILKRFYGVEVALEPTAMLTVPHPETGLHRYYRPRMDDSYTEVVAKGELPKLSEAQIQQLLN
ncbi:MAG: hypothetical protein AAFN92_18870, partial [Bacteroidota bacterium]